MELCLVWYNHKMTFLNPELLHKFYFVGDFANPESSE